MVVSSLYLKNLAVGISGVTSVFCLARGGCLSYVSSLMQNTWKGACID